MENIGVVRLVEDTVENAKSDNVDMSDYSDLHFATTQHQAQSPE